MRVCVVFVRFCGCVCVCLFVCLFVRSSFVVDYGLFHGVLFLVVACCINVLLVGRCVLRVAFLLLVACYLVHVVCCVLFVVC